MTKLLQYIGLCRRAGSVLRGAEVIERSLAKTARPLCVVLAKDASDRTARQTKTKCEAAGVLCASVDADMYTLAKAIGASSPCAALAILPGKGPGEMVARLLRESCTPEKDTEEADPAIQTNISTDDTAK